MSGEGLSVWNIPPGVPFADALADGLAARAGDDDMALGDMLVLLPTRRACRALAEAFLRRTEGAAVILPRMMPLGESEDDGLLAPEDLAEGGATAELPPAIPELQRLVYLSRLIGAGHETSLGGAPLTAGNAVRLAQDLARLLDQIQTEGLEFSALSGLVPDEYADHWWITLDFLKLLTGAWPAVLEEQGCLDPADRRDRIIRGQADQWASAPPRFPVFAAGSTGSIPATAALLQTIAGLPGGGVVLPALDPELTADAANALPPTHPQFGMAELLRRFDIAPEDVPEWPASCTPACPPARAALVRDAMAPPSGAALQPFDDAEAALEKVRLITCPGQTEEAGIIGLAMRGALETPGRTAALITPDRILARRVAAELRRWDIEIDDSAGQPLSETPPGLFLRLTATCFAEECAPLSLIAMLKHPLAAGGMNPAGFRARVREIEIAALRGPRPAPGLDSISEILAGEEKHAALFNWFRDFAARSAAFAGLMSGTAPLPFGELLRTHIDFIEWLSSDDEAEGAALLWGGPAGMAAAEFIAELDNIGDAGEIAPADYPAMLETLMGGHMVRPPFGTHPRLHIWGLLEARLQSADLICLGGLNEGTWPADPGADPWMSRQMRDAFGLPPLERRIGLSAHDFAQAFCAEEVLLTRADRVEGSPTVPSRWLLMLENRLRAGETDSRAPNPLELGGGADDFAGWQAALDWPETINPVAAPEPRPDVGLRPRKLSVTTIQKWRRDPYSIFAQYVLKLKPLEDLDADPGAAERGTIIHKALDKFITKYPRDLPADPMAALLECGEAAFAPYISRPAVRAFWWPRFLRLADWFLAEEIKQRGAISESHTESVGVLKFDAPGGDFSLTAHADRIDLLSDGSLVIIDYKTGDPPSPGMITQGYEPQLPLEAAIAQAGGFKGVAAAKVSLLEFWQMSGGRVPGARKPVKEDAAALAEAARDGLAALIREFDDPATPYLSQPDSRRASRFPEYDHLARVAEWSVGEGGDE